MAAWYDIAGNLSEFIEGNLMGGNQKRTQGWQAANAAGSRAYASAAPQRLAAPQSINLGANDQWLKDLQSSNAALMNQLASYKASIPRFVNYDVAGSWAKAKEMATNAVSPIYQQKMTDFINRQQVELGRQRADTETGKGALDTALSRLMEDTATQRTRTQQDTETNVADINALQDFNARMEGLNYDTASRALNEGLGEAGTVASGLGQGAIQEAQIQRNSMSNEQLRQSENKVEAQRTLMNRNFQDLEVQETRGTEDTSAKKGKLDLDLERFIEDQAFELDQERKANEMEKQAEIAKQSSGYQQQLVDQWIQSLSGKGYTAQEIANAASIYR